jgi:hypothetical protein
MVKLDPKAAAAAIASSIDHDHASKEPAGGHHSLAYITEVTQTLGMQPNSANLAYVAQVLTARGVAQHLTMEYPKWVHVKARLDDHTKLLAATGHNRVNFVADDTASLLFDHEDDESEFFDKHGDRWPRVDAAA